MSCDKCVWGHNNHRDVEEPNHCKCQCHCGFQNTSTFQRGSKMNYQCPKCNGVLTPWSDKIHVCDVCGYGKTGDEYEILQKTKILITKQSRSNQDE